MLSFGKNLRELLKIDFPVIMAPMFLVSNKDMLEAGMRSGIMATFPSLNYRKEAELGALLDELNMIHKAYPNGSYGINLIVQKTNIYFEKHLKICVEKKVPFYITSLGNPAEVIKAARSYGAKVFCDITNMEHAKKCHAAGCDGFIAVGQGAGGHAGPHPLQVLIPALRKQFPDTPIVAAGGITGGEALLSLQILGAEGVSMGTRFIASTEASVSDAYKTAIVNAGMDDIVMTSKLSGTPATIIDTPSAKKLGYEQNWFEKYMSRNPRAKKWFKMLVQVRGMKKLEQSVLPNNYLQLWCAGKSAELIHEILSCEEIVAQIKKEYTDKLEEINQN
ncbi:MAG: 2-nitropropane dioxygenase [Bacteroidetes bacterium]|jgi:nitronate monooxygenase|nr:2-nitropropane dioxygenase [Bacteroidota bacterium]